MSSWKNIKTLRQLQKIRMSEWKNLKIVKAVTYSENKRIVSGLAFMSKEKIKKNDLIKIKNLFKN